MIFFSSDPNGYLQHLVVGLVLTTIFLIMRISLVWVIVFALLKECQDFVYKNYFDIWDFLFTIFPLILEYVKTRFIQTDNIDP